MDRYVWLPNKFPINIEADKHPHCTEEMAGQFHGYDGESTEYEVLNWLWATIQILKPERVLETGASLGLGTVAMAHACKMNGFGKVHSLEISSVNCRNVRELLAENHLSKYAEVHETDSIDFLNKTDLHFDMAFFDSDVKIRPAECEICLRRDTLRRLAVFHDTSPTRLKSAPNYDGGESYRNKILDFTVLPQCSGYFDSVLSRGFIALFLRDL